MVATPQTANIAKKRIFTLGTTRRADNCYIQIPLKLILLQLDHIYDKLTLIHSAYFCDLTAKLSVGHQCPTNLNHQWPTIYM